MSWTITFTSTATPRRAVWSQRFKKRPDHTRLTRAFREGSGYRGRPIKPNAVLWNGVEGKICARYGGAIGTFKVDSTGGDWS